MPVTETIFGTEKAVGYQVRQEADLGKGNLQISSSKKV